MQLDFGENTVISSTQNLRILGEVRLDQSRNLRNSAQSPQLPGHAPNRNCKLQLRVSLRLLTNTARQTIAQVELNKRGEIPHDWNRPSHKKTAILCGSSLSCLYFQGYRGQKNRYRMCVMLEEAASPCFGQVVCFFQANRSHALLKRCVHNHSTFRKVFVLHLSALLQLWQVSVTMPASMALGVRRTNTCWCRSVNKPLTKRMDPATQMSLCLCLTDFCHILRSALALFVCSATLR